MLSIALLAIIMAALTTFSITVTASSTYQRQRQSAVQLANTQLERVRGVPAGELSVGRRQADTSAQFAAAPAAVAPWLTGMAPTDDPTAAAGSTATMPVTSTATVNNTAFTATSYLGWCTVPTDPSAGTDCARATTAAAATHLRVVVAVRWTGGRCPAGMCSYLASTLVSTTADPVFTLNQPAPAAPQVQPVGDRASTIGDTVNLQLALQSGTGVAPTTWQATGLPPGLSADPNGLITGNPTALGSSSVTVTVTDAFLRTATDTFTWTVYPKVLAATPGAQTALQGTAVRPLTLTATGGGGAPYTWTDPGSTLPAGLTLSSDGVVSGTPTAVGTSTVTLTAADAGKRSGTATFTWRVYPPLTAMAADRSWTVGTPVGSVAFTAGGGSGGPYTWSDPATTLPAGLTISSTGVVTGTPTATGASPVVLRVTDTADGYSKDVPFTWTILAAPTVTGLTDPFRTTRGATLTAQRLPYTCPSASCTLTLAGAPAGVGISTTTTSTTGSVLTVTSTSGYVYLRGTVAAAATPGPYAVTVTPLDTVSTTAGTATTAAWTVFAPPTVKGLTNPFRTTVGAVVSNQTLSYTCPTASCTLTLSAPAGIGLSGYTTGGVITSGTVSATSGTVYLRGTVGGPAPSGTTVTLTVTDRVSTTSGTGDQAAWTVYARPTVTGLAATSTTTQGATLTPLGLPWTCPSGSCTLAFSGAPVGLGIAATSAGPFGASVPVSATSGTVYYGGTVDRAATVTSYPVAVTPTDTTTSVTGTATTTTLTVTDRCTATQKTNYLNAVAFDAPSTWYRLGEAGGTVATDAGSAKNNGTYVGTAALGRVGALSCDPSTAVGFNGSTTQVTPTSTVAVAGTDTFSLEAWFSTTVGGGKIIGFGNSQTGTSNTYDRQIYLTTTGQVVFGVYPNATKTVISPATYLDGKYHHVVATLSTAGMVLYVDGAKVAGDLTVTTGQSFNGYWRVGYDNLSGWTGAGNPYFVGSLDEVAVYPTALSAARVAAHYTADR